MDETFTLKMSIDDRNLLERLAEIEGESMSTVVRTALRQMGKEYRIWPPVAGDVETPAETMEVAA